MSTKIKYFPFTEGDFSHALGVRAIESTEKLIENSLHYAEEIRLKRKLLENHPDECIAVSRLPVESQCEVAEYLISHCDYLSGDRNLLLNEPLVFGHDPLLSVASHLQEDLVVLANVDSQDFPIIGGVVCFPSGWSIREKMGLCIFEVHAPVPQFAPTLGNPTYQLLRRLKTHRPVWRMNWGIRPTAQLDQAPRHAEYLRKQQALVDAQNAGRRCILRIERQTLSRMPTSGNILFTIHTHQTPLADLDSHQAACVLHTLKTCPPEIRAYKGISAIADPVIQYLSSHRSSPPR
jgi:dimethylamine monooxygenase subunit A